jgi:hypothetical protein
MMLYSKKKNTDCTGEKVAVGERYLQTNLADGMAAMTKKIPLTRISSVAERELYFQVHGGLDPKKHNRDTFRQACQDKVGTGNPYSVTSYKVHLNSNDVNVLRQPCKPTTIGGLTLEPVATKGRFVYACCRGDGTESVSLTKPYRKRCIDEMFENAPFDKVNTFYKSPWNNFKLRPASTRSYKAKARRGTRLDVEDATGGKNTVSKLRYGGEATCTVGSLPCWGFYAGLGIVILIALTLTFFALSRRLRQSQSSSAPSNKPEVVA